MTTAAPTHDPAERARNLIDKGVRIVRDSDDYFGARIARVERDGRMSYALWINGAPVADADSADECRRLLAAVLLAASKTETET